MAVRSITFQIALIVLIIVGIILIVQSSWTLTQLNKTVGDTCACSGVTDQELNSLRIMSILTLLIGLGIIVYAIIMFIMPTKEKRQKLQEKLHNKIAERFATKSA